MTTFSPPTAADVEAMFQPGATFDHFADFSFVEAPPSPRLERWRKAMNALIHDRNWLIMGHKQIPPQGQRWNHLHPT